MHCNTNNTGIFSHCWRHIRLLSICTKKSVTGQLTGGVHLYVNFSNLSLVLCIFPDDSSLRPKHVGEKCNGFYPYLFSCVGFWWHKEGSWCSYMLILMVWQVYVVPTTCYKIAGLENYTITSSTKSTFVTLSCIQDCLDKKSLDFHSERMQELKNST